MPHWGDFDQTLGQIDILSFNRPMVCVRDVWKDVDKICWAFSVD
jgi:hypothetical protein